MSAAPVEPLDPSTTIPDLQALIEYAIDHYPRRLQLALGPSDIANDCDRCLVETLGKMHSRLTYAGPTMDPEQWAANVRDQGSPWLPTIGRCVHSWLDEVARNNPLGRWLPESRVTVGTVGGQPISGSADVYDLWTDTVVDYKVVGLTTLKDFRAHGAKASYRRQIMLYGLGFWLLGYPVHSVAIWCLPRNGWTIDRGYLHQEPFDHAFALATLARAESFYRAIEMFGYGTVISSAPEHTHKEFSCPAPIDENPEKYFADIIG